MDDKFTLRYSLKGKHCHHEQRGIFPTMKNTNRTAYEGLALGPSPKVLCLRLCSQRAASASARGKGQGARGKGQGRRRPATLDLLDVMDALNSDWIGHPRPCLVTPNLV